MDPVEAKIAGMICLGIGTLGVGLAPAWFSAHSQQWPLLLSSLLCFGGGVLFSTSLVHILPELREITEYAELLLCTGFFFLYVTDEIVHYFWSDNGKHQNRNHPIVSDPYRRNPKMMYGSIETLHENPRQPPPFSRGNSRNDVYAESCHVSHTEPCSNPQIGQWGLLIALSLHAILEGLAVGLEDKPSKVWLLVGAVASHKLVVGFCLGAELSSGPGNTACRHFSSIIIFTMGSVAGIGIGMVVTDVSTEWTETVQPILQGLAAGTLLYVTVCEVLPRERARWHNQTRRPSASLVQAAAMIFGFVLMTLITRYLGKEKYVIGDFY